MSDWWKQFTGAKKQAPNTGFDLGAFNQNLDRMLPASTAPAQNFAVGSNTNFKMPQLQDINPSYSNINANSMNFGMGADSNTQFFKPMKIDSEIGGITGAGNGTDIATDDFTLGDWAGGALDLGKLALNYTMGMEQRDLARESMAQSKLFGTANYGAQRDTVNNQYRDRQTRREVENGMSVADARVAAQNYVDSYGIKSLDKVKAGV